MFWGGRFLLDGVAHTSLRMRAKLVAADPGHLQQEGEEGDGVGVAAAHALSKGTKWRVI